MSYFAIAYLVAIPFAVWFELANPSDHGLGAKLTQKASDGFERTSWMFRGGYGIYKWCWVIVASPFTIGLMAIATIIAAAVVAPAIIIYQRVTGNKLYDRIW